MYKWSRQNHLDQLYIIFTVLLSLSPATWTHASPYSAITDLIAVVINSTHTMVSPLVNTTLQATALAALSNVFGQWIACYQSNVCRPITLGDDQN